MVTLPDRIKGVLARHVRIFGHESDGNDYAAGVDRVHGALKIIDAIHAKIHAGGFYEVSYIDDALTASGGTLDVLITPALRDSVHVQLTFSAEGPARAYLYENPVISAAGTSFTPVNRNRRAYAPAARAVIEINPTVTSPGDKLTENPIFGSTGVGQSFSGGGGSLFLEWELKENMPYLFRLTNVHDSAIGGWVGMLFYEEALQL